MEATSELGKIVPPRLEDAGLEDCALPPDAIREAFFRAASAVKSRATSIFSTDEDESDCVSDPWPEAKEGIDVVVGVDPEQDVPGPCAAEKGGGVPVVGADDVVAPDVGGEEVKEGEEACVDGLQGLEIKEKAQSGEEDEEETEGTGSLTISFRNIIYRLITERRI